MANSKNTQKKGLAASTTNPLDYKRKTKFTDNSLHNQRLKLLDWLFERTCITTAQARDNLDIMHPAGRIKELKRAGYLIVTIWVSWISDHNIKHRIARYVLTQKQPIDCEVA